MLLAADLGQGLQEAPRLLRLAFECYQSGGNAVGTRQMRERLESLGEDVSDLPVVSRAPRRQIPWFWIRLGAEVLILGLAAYFFMLR